MLVRAIVYLLAFGIAASSTGCTVLGYLVGSPMDRTTRDQPDDVSELEKSRGAIFSYNVETDDLIKFGRLVAHMTEPRSEYVPRYTTWYDTASKSARVPDYNELLVFNRAGMPTRS